MFSIVLQTTWQPCWETVCPGGRRAKWQAAATGPYARRPTGRGGEGCPSGHGLCLGSRTLGHSVTSLCPPLTTGRKLIRWEAITGVFMGFSVWVKSQAFR